MVNRERLQAINTIYFCFKGHHPTLKAKNKLGWGSEYDLAYLEKGMMKSD